MKRDIDKQIENMLREKGATNIEFYMLVNNDGFTFEYKGKRYDLRHWRNVYGVECDFWDCSCLDRYEDTTNVERSFMKAVKDAANEINERDD